MTTAAEIVEQATGRAVPEDREAAGAVAVVEHVTGRYRVGATPEGEAFAVPLDGPQVVVLLGERGGRLRDTVTADLYASTGRVPSGKALDDGMRVVVAQARAVGDRTALHLRVAEHDGALVLDLAEPGSGRCVVVRPGSWALQENPPDGVLFRRTSASRPLPAPVVDGSLEPLRELLGFAAGDPRWYLLRGWLVAAPFATCARPLVCLLGPPGGAKTTRGRMVVSVLDPRDELGSNFGRKIEDDQVKALGRYLVSYDNLASVSEAVSDHLCRLVTGEEIDRRRLYSDTDLSTLTYRRTGVLTAVGLPALRADALERVVVVAVDRIDEGDRRSEADLRAAFAAEHPVILGGLLDALADTLARLPEVRAASTARPRMADYFDVLTAHDPAAARAYRDATRDVMVEAAEADPFVAAVLGWLASVGGSFAGSAGDAWQQADRHRRQTGSGWSEQWWPRGGPQFGTALTRATEPLRAVGVDVARSKTNGRRLLMLQAGTAQGQRGTAIGGAVPAAVPAKAPGQSPVGPRRDSRDSTSGSFPPYTLLEKKRGVGGAQGPASAVPAVPAVPEDDDPPFGGSTARPAPLLAVPAVAALDDEEPPW